jgi:hypothetical protein
VLSRSSRGGFVALLPEDHVFCGEPANLNEQLPRSASLRPSIEQAPVTSLAALGRPWRRTNILFTAIFNAALFADASLRFAPFQSVVVWHHSLHGML